MARIEAIRTMLADRNENILKFLFSPADPYTITDSHGEMNLEFIEKNIGVLSSGEQIMCRVAMDIWGGYGKAGLEDIVCRLDTENFNRVISALIQFRLAMG